MGDTVSDTCTSAPSLRTRTVSRFSIGRPRRISASTAGDWSGRPSGSMSEIRCPIASAAVWPYRRSAPAFHDSITPSSVFEMIASSDDSMIAARS